MTACAFDTALTGGVGDRPRGDFTIASDRSYGARLALSEEACCWYPERWTLDGPEPYAVPLPAAQPEEPDCELLPLADGQVLIHRRVAGHHAFSLLYPAGPGTGERPLGGIDRADVSLLPPAPGGLCAFALGRGPRSTSVWLVAGGGVLVPQHLAEVPGRCTGGSWLDRTGRLLALDRELDGRTKTVVVDLRRGGETSPLLQITERSDDRLLLADPDSGLLLVRSDAPGEERLGWGVLGSTRPVRFPDCLRPAGWSQATPFAVQPGQVLTPEACAVAFRVDGRGGAGRPWVGVWRPAERRLREFPAPEGWLPGAGLWTRDGELRLPYATPQVPCGLARVRLSGAAGAAGAWRPDEATGARRPDGAAEAWPRGEATGSRPAGSAAGAWPRDDGATGSWRPDEVTGARRIARVARVARVLSEPSGRVAEEPPRPAGPVPAGPGPAGPGPAGARDTQTPRTTSPAAEIATRITPWARVGGPGGSDPARTPGLTPLRPPEPAPELGPSRTAGLTPELRPSRTAGLAPSRTPAPARTPEPMPVPVRMPESEVGSGVEPWGGTGSWAGVEQEMGPEPDPDPRSGTGPALRPVPLQQAPLARPPQPRPPRWVRDHHRG
ncbi:hypothetical protein ACK1X7_15685 [Streptomyces sp. CY1]|uniref:hypothetical protein n=1 Tax=Streptomyces sp. CY1 TaxID=3388313 RepID=UPI0039A057A7